MLKHQNIIDKLTKEQKIALLTDSGDALGDVQEELKLPTTAINELWEENITEDGEFLFPSPKSLAHSWSDELFGKVSYALASLGASYGDNLFILPGTNAASSLYGRELAEEPHLSGELIRGACHGLKEKGISYCLKSPTYEACDVRFLDDEADKSVLYDRVARPFKLAMSEGATAVYSVESDLDEKYGIPSRELVKNTVPDGVQKIIKIQDSDLTTSSLTEGKHVIGGSSLVISTALDNYHRIYRSMEEGGATAHELQMTLADGAAISQATIDEAVDRKLSLAYTTSSPFEKATKEQIEQIAYEATLESCVLLKNANKALPLKKKEKIALIGDIVFNPEASAFKSFTDKAKAAIEECNATMLGFERGYILDQNVSHDLIEPAVTLAKKATATVVFLGLGAQREERLHQTAHLALPGNQIALLTKLRAVCKKLVVVICGERLPDMVFDSLADAILLAPLQGAYVAKSTVDILMGKFNPGGSLAYAGYYNVDKSFRQIQKRKRTNEQKIGPYIGYRYADANGEASRYPLGYGLSYTIFTYSSLSVNNRRGEITFTVKNNGHKAGYEVAQLYVGRRTSGRIRPVKELKWCKRIFLKAGERKKLTVSTLDLEIFDEVSGELITEDGAYEIFVGSSSSSIWLSGKITRTGTRLEAQENRLSDYLHNVSNILSEGYIMEAYCKPMNKKSKLKSFGAILLLATLFADAVYAISCITLELDFMWYLTVFAIINGVCLTAAIIFMIVGSSKLKKAIKAQEKAEAKELFKTIELADVNEISQLFEDEFDVLLEDSTVSAEEEKAKDESAYTYMSVDTDIPTLAKDLEEHFKDCGIKITPKMARKLVSGIMSSRLLIVRNALGFSAENIADMLARFFGSTPHSENINGAAWDRKSLLRMKAEGDTVGRSAPLMQAFTSAINEPDSLNFYGLDNILLKDAGDMLMPFVQYFGNPDAEHTVADDNGRLTIPANLWFVISPAKDQSIDDIPAFVANLATVIDLEGEKCAANLGRSTKKSITVYQMDALVFRAKKSSEINEETWKCVDSLEAFVNEKTPYHIGNKLFLQLEKYMAIYNACGADEHEAIDCAIASQLLPAIMSLLKGNEAMADVDLAQIVESILGEEYATNCRNLIKRPVMNKGKASSPVAAPVAKGAKTTEFKAGEAKIEVEKPKAEIKTEAPKAEIKTEAPKAEIKTEAPKAEIKTEAPKAEIKTEAPKAEIKTEAPKAEIKTEAPKAEIKTEAPKATIVTSDDGKATIIDDDSTGGGKK